MKPPRNRAGVLRLARRLYGLSATIEHHSGWLTTWYIYAYNHYRMMQSSSLRELGHRLLREWEWTQTGGRRAA